ncbi:MAG: 2-hydroxyacyl-CoA dehydratase [Desulfobacterales bacterium]|nr:2-hydroxyacyl-CoA dehydratase [Desulfobacterales bacterium]
MKEINSLLSVLINNPRNLFIEKAIEEEMIPIIYTSSYVPYTFFSMERLFPVRTIPLFSINTALADNYLSGNSCAYIRNICEDLLRGKYDFSRGFICSTVCDQMVSFFKNFKHLFQSNFAEIIDIPRKINHVSAELFKKHIENFKDSLGYYFGISFDPLPEYINAQNEYDAIVISILKLLKESNPPLTGSEFHKFLSASLMSPNFLFFSVANEFKTKIENRKGLSHYRARLGVIGECASSPYFTEDYESSGAIVVCRNDWPLSLDDTINENIEPFEALSNFILNKASFSMGTESVDSKAEKILEKFSEYKVDGIIIERLKYCSLWGIKSALLPEALKKRGIPTLTIERNYTYAEGGYIKNQIDAFLESIDK